MNDEVLIAVLRARGSTLTPVGFATLVKNLTDGGLPQGSIVTYFKRAFPSVPIRVLFEVGDWHRVNNGNLTDEDFDRLLGSWLGMRGERD